MKAKISSLVMGGIAAIGAPLIGSPASAAPHVVEASEGAAGQLVCRAQSLTEGTFELVLAWQGEAAKGSLRRVAPSGNVYLQTVRAERHGSLIVADDVLEKDLVVHAAVVQEQKGKRYMRAGDDKQPWLTCA